MKRLMALCLASICLIITSCQQPSASAEEMTAINNVTPLAETPAPAAPVHPVIYRDFHVEKGLRHGYQFGMTLSQWNKHLASMAEKGIAKELSKIRFVDGPGSVLTIGSYKAFFPVDTSNGIHSSRQGFFVSGLFAHRKDRGDTVEVFRINGEVTNEPVLIGLQLDCEIPDHRINGAIQAMVDIDELEPLAGGRLPYTTNEALTPDDFSNVIAEGFGKLNREIGKKNDDEKYATKQMTDRTLLQCPLFYCVLELIEKRHADVMRDDEYRVTYISNAYRTYHLVQKIYSKAQSNLDITEYMTVDELENYRNAGETRKLIEEARQ